LIFIFFWLRIALFAFTEIEIEFVIFLLLWGATV